MERYQDAALSIEDRAADLLSRMTLLEKIRQTDQYFTFDFTERTPEGRVEKVDWDAMKQSMGNELFLQQSGNRCKGTAGSRC